MDVRIMMAEFCNVCGRILTQPGLSTELTYRIKKMMDSVAPIEDKVYLKTLKGKETLLRCIEKVRFVKDHSAAHDEFLYRLLSDLETTCDDLLNLTYEFRIKAG